MCPRGRHGREVRPRHRIRRAFPERGWIMFLLLRLLYEEPMHGYQLMGELESRGYTHPGRFETGSIYTILKRMKGHGLLTSEEITGETGRTRRVYQITQMGVEQLKTGLESVIKRKRLLDELAAFYKKHFHGETPDEQRTGGQ